MGTSERKDGDDEVSLDFLVACFKVLLVKGVVLRSKEHHQVRSGAPTRVSVLLEIVRLK